MATILVEIPDHNGFTKREVEEYVRDAVATMAGGCGPDHPFGYGFLRQRGKLKVGALTERQEHAVYEALSKSTPKTGFAP